ncbi:hypothetical protein [Streptomyces caniferus]|nr:hypothetical protein [Streptomyces caniferus]
MKEPRVPPSQKVVTVAQPTPADWAVVTLPTVIRRRVFWAHSSRS